MASSPSSAAANKAAASTEAASSAGLSQGAAFQKYRELAQESNRLVSKISELEMERGEHVLVEETLRPLDPDRRAYRLVGEVLVERNVQEVLPSVEGNRKNVSPLTVPKLY